MGYHLPTKYNHNHDVYENIAHRGLQQLCPENTLCAIEAAIVHGADSVEFDVVFSSDGEPMVIHDITVDRTTNGTGAVNTKTKAQLQALDAGTKFSPLYAGVKIPTLDEVLAVCRGRFRQIYLEIKQYRTTADIEIIVQKLRAHGYEENTWIVDFVAGDLSHVRQYSSKVGFVIAVDTVEAFNAALLIAVADARCMVGPWIQILTTDLVAAAKTQGLELLPWSAASTGDIETCLKYGLTRIIQDTLFRGRV